MRQKTRRPRRSRGPERPTGAAGQDPAEWVLVNETGWGMPHWIIAAIAGLFVLARVVGWFLDRTAADRSPASGPEPGRPPRQD